MPLFKFVSDQEAVDTFRLPLYKKFHHLSTQVKMIRHSVFVLSNENYINLNAEMSHSSNNRIVGLPNQGIIRIT